MKKLIFLLLIPFSVVALDAKEENSVPYAPLLPLEPEFPLYVSNQNRHLMTFDQAELEQTIKMFEEHSFPWLWLMGFLAVALGGGYYWKLRKEKEQSLVIVKQKHQQESQLIEKLAQIKETFSGEEHRESYLQLVELLEQVLRNRFKIQMKVFSPSEIPEILGELPLNSPDLKNTLLDVLEKAYYVKFANEQPSSVDCGNALKVISAILST